MKKEDIITGKKYKVVDKTAGMSFEEWKGQVEDYDEEDDEDDMGGYSHRFNCYVTTVDFISNSHIETRDGYSFNFEDLMPLRDASPYEIEE
jgi:hypothetical protein